MKKLGKERQKGELRRRNEESPRLRSVQPLMFVQQITTLTTRLTTRLHPELDPRTLYLKLSNLIVR